MGDRTLTGTATLGQSGSGNEDVFHIPHNLTIRFFSVISRILVCEGRVSYPYAEMQLMYSTVLIN